MKRCKGPEHRLFKPRKPQTKEEKEKAAFINQLYEAIVDKQSPDAKPR